MHYGRPPRRAESSDNEILVFALETPGLGLGDGNEFAALPYRFIRDPQIFAKAFVPKKHRKK
jgi:hypothetical protein